MPTRSVHCFRKLPVSVDEVWPTLNRFDVSWHPSVVRCDLLRSSSGSLLRNFEDTSGQVYEERRTYFSTTDRVLCYEMVAGITGLHSYIARIEVTGADGCALVTWHADVVAEADRIEDICNGTKAIFEAGLEALSVPIKSKAIRHKVLGKDRSELNFQDLPGVPSLSLLNSDPVVEGSDTLVLFLHGIGGNATNWADQLSALGCYYKMTALNFRGYGESTLGIAPSEIDDYCKDILAVMQAKGAKRLVLIGLSYGSWIATSFAMRHSDVLAGLVLFGGCTGMSEADPREREKFRVSREVPLDAGQVPADFAPEVVDIISGPNATETQRKKMLESMSDIPSTTYRDALNCFCNPLERFDFGKITCPVLLCTGEYDQLAQPKEIRRVSERIHETRQFADVQFEVIKGAGHVCNLEAPAAVNAVLHHFLSRLPNVACEYKSSNIEKKREKRERIRQAAHDEFCENGFDGASMDRIATRAIVSKPTLYQYFDDKNGLFKAVLDAGRNQMVTPLMAKDVALVDRLWQFAWIYAEIVLRPDLLSLARLMLGEAQRRPESAIAYHENGPGRALEGLIEFVESAAQDGHLEVDAADLAAQDLWSLILSGTRDHCLHYVEYRPSEAELTRSIGHGLRVFLKAYATEPELEIAALSALISAKI
ncbi:MAG: alpha/beta fold hydrolase [Marinovum sp.]|nr:alpha/beta fold hydrolase [Marinovum sp.]